MAAMRAPKPGGSRGGKFKPCPAGPQQIVCCDIVDLGWEVSGKFKDKHGAALRQRKIRLKWQSEHLMDDGKPYVVAKKYTFSVDRRATLRKDLDAWRGRPFTDEEAAEFDFERLIGVNAFASIVHTARGGDVYADVQSLMPAPAKLPKLTVKDYVRVAERAKAKEEAKRARAAQDRAATEADAPPGHDQHFAGAADDDADQRQPGDEDDWGGHDPDAPEPPDDDDTPF